MSTDDPKRSAEFTSHQQKSPGFWKGVLQLTDSGSLEVQQSAGADAVVVESAIDLFSAEGRAEIGEIARNATYPGSGMEYRMDDADALRKKERKLHVELRFDYLPDAVLLSQLLWSTLLRCLTEELPIIFQYEPLNLEIRLSDVKKESVDNRTDEEHKSLVEPELYTENEFDQLKKSQGFLQRLSFIMRSSEDLKTPLTWTFFRNVPPEFRPHKLLNAESISSTTTSRRRREHDLNMCFSEFLLCHEFIDLQQLSAHAASKILAIRKEHSESEASEDSKSEQLLEDYELLAKLIGNYYAASKGLIDLSIESPAESKWPDRIKKAGKGRTR